MSLITRLSTASAAVAILVLVTTVGLGPGRCVPAWLNSKPHTRVAMALGKGVPKHPLPRCATMGFASNTMLSPDASDAEQVEHLLADYDRIVVEVHRDGSLLVLGKAMPMDTFRSLLGGQQHEGIKTVVAIRAEDGCVFQHIGRVIRLCEDLGIPHLMMAEPVPRTDALMPPAAA